MKPFALDFAEEANSTESRKFLDASKVKPKTDFLPAFIDQMCNFQKQSTHGFLSSRAAKRGAGSRSE
jgi:hypothetical protein